MTFKHCSCFSLFSFLFCYHMKYKIRTINNCVDIMSGSSFYGKNIGEVWKLFRYFSLFLPQNELKSWSISNFQRIWYCLRILLVPLNPYHLIWQKWSFVIWISSWLLNFLNTCGYMITSYIVWKKPCRLQLFKAYFPSTTIWKLGFAIFLCSSYCRIALYYWDGSQ